MTIANGSGPASGPALSAEAAALYSPLALAYLGDAVFELCVRIHMMELGQLPVVELNRRAKALVNAQAQSRMYFALLDKVEETEADILRRGRNAKAPTKARHASITAYRHATGVEALFGYLKLTGQEERLRYVFQLCLDAAESGETDESDETAAASCPKEPAADSLPEK